MLEERLAETQARMRGLVGQNEKLVATLREARDQVIALKEEIDRLGQPPSGYGVFLTRHDDGAVDVFTQGRKLRVTVSPAVEVAELRRGQEVMLNEAMNVVQALGLRAPGRGRTAQGDPRGRRPGTGHRPCAMKSVSSCSPRRSWTDRCAAATR